LRDRGRLRTDELRHAGLLRDEHIDDGGTGIHRTPDDESALVDCLLNECARGLRISLRIVFGHRDFLAGNTAGRVDFLEREPHSVAPVRA
jgi:hypothetical protein